MTELMILSIKKTELMIPYATRLAILKYKYMYLVFGLVRSHV